MMPHWFLPPQCWAAHKLKTARPMAMPATHMPTTSASSVLGLRVVGDRLMAACAWRFRMRILH